MNGQLFTGHHGLSATSADLSLNEFIACFAKEKTEPLATQGTTPGPPEPPQQALQPQIWADSPEPSSSAFSSEYVPVELKRSFPVFLPLPNYCLIWGQQSSTKCPKHADATTKSIIDRQPVVGVGKPFDSRATVGSKIGAGAGQEQMDDLVWADINDM